MRVEPTQNFPLLWKALLFLLIFMLFGPVLQRIFVYALAILNQDDALNRFIRELQNLNLKETYLQWMPAQTILGIVVALKVLRNKGVSKVFISVAAISVYCILAAITIYQHLFSFSLETILVDGFSWILTALCCWNFARLFNAQLPLRHAKLPHTQTENFDK